jgi:hypothetical protein
MASNVMRACATVGSETNAAEGSETKAADPKKRTANKPTHVALPSTEFCSNNRSLKQGAAWAGCVLRDQSMPLKVTPACATVGSEINTAVTIAEIARRMNLCMMHLLSLCTRFWSVQPEFGGKPRLGRPVMAH